MWKFVMALVVIALVFATMQSCSLNNDILKPNCEVFEVELVEKAWHPADNREQLIFHSNHRLEVNNSQEDITWEISNCNTVMVTNHTAGTLQAWTIDNLNLEQLVIIRNKERVTYTNK